MLNRLAVLEALCASQARTITQLQAEINDLHCSLAGSAIAEVSAAAAAAAAAVIWLQTRHAALQTSPSPVLYVGSKVLQRILLHKLGVLLVAEPKQMVM